MTTKGKIKLALLTALVAVLLTGCLRITADELYYLPEISEEYLRLQAHINIILSHGAEYAPPTRGPNRQAVQVKDLTGTGTNEVIAFFSVPGESTLKIYIFELDGDDYAVADIIEGVGTEIESVRFVDMNGDGTMELVIGWQMGAALKYMTIYSIVGFQHEVLVSGEEYSEITTFDTVGDGNTDVIVFRMPTQETGAVAKLFSLMQDGEIVTEEARLSNGIESISRILTGRLADNIPGMFVESEGRFENGSLVTDILARQEGSFTNISLHSPSGISEDTVRHRMGSSEVNKDGIIKTPVLRRLVAQSETEYYAIDWYAYSSNGQSSLALTTYHNNFDEWFLILPFDWREKVSVRREDAVPGERTIIFSYYDETDETYEDFLKILKLSGDNTQERAGQDNRVLLMTEGAAAYAFELLAPPNSFGLSFDEELIKENFRLIYSDWLTGVGN
jgi:hypothetical protein